MDTKKKKKLALQRETLAALQPDVLGGIAGGQGVGTLPQPDQGGLSIPLSRLGDNCQTRPVTVCDPLQTRFLCPSVPSLPGGR